MGLSATDFDKILEDVIEQARLGAREFGVIGSDRRIPELLAWFSDNLPLAEVTVFSEDQFVHLMAATVQPVKRLRIVRPTVVVVMENAQKEELLWNVVDDLGHNPKLIISGYQHYSFLDSRFKELAGNLLSPSIANGYPSTLIHIYECLVNADRLGLKGSIVEFGVFKGGTTRFIADLTNALEQKWEVFGFDTFGGFPSRRSPLDMYDHPGAEFSDFDSVKRYLEPVGVNLVQGDIVETAGTLGTRPIVLAFFDTDNYSSAKAGLEAVVDHIVPGGAIVFDHFTGLERFRYTLGERMAARPLIDDERYFNLHGTGVFLRQK